VKNFVLLGANTARTKAYLQFLTRTGNIPAHVFIMTLDPKSLIEESNNFRSSSSAPLTEDFLLEEPILYTLQSYGVSYQFVATESVNSLETIEALNQNDALYVIYSGFGGQIVKSDVLSLGKKFLHVHPGVVPYYRGSTTIYYSLLKEGAIGASAIFLEDKLDCGALLKTKWFDLSKLESDVDYKVDPYIRATLLVEVIEEYKIRGYFETETQIENKGETYYIIHPVLKHIAMLSDQTMKKVEEI
jgi:methionyl-tRNA formyltransferase